MRVVLALLLLAGCAGRQQVEPAAPALASPPAEWRTLVTASDRARLYRWREALTRGLRSAREGGHGAEIGREGALLQPDAALDRAELPLGNYRCRVTKLGTQGDGTLAYVAYPAFACAVTRVGGETRLIKLTGSQRQEGRLYPDGPRRQVFLGTLALGDEARAPRYGSDRDRDVVGALERIGERRWRLIMPYPRFESLADVMELVPG